MGMEGEGREWRGYRMSEGVEKWREGWKWGGEGVINEWERGGLTKSHCCEYLVVDGQKDSQHLLVPELGLRERERW